MIPVMATISLMCPDAAQVLREGELGRVDHRRSICPNNASITTAEPIQGVHHITVAGVLQHVLTGPIGGRARLLVDPDPLTGGAGLGDGVELAVEVLLRRRHPGVPRSTHGPYQN